MDVFLCIIRVALPMTDSVSLFPSSVINTHRVQTSADDFHVVLSRSSVGVAVVK